jgi:hypothetical protein
MAASSVRKEKGEEKRVFLRPSPAVRSCLEELAAQGILGRNKTEVAETLVIDGIRRLIREGMFDPKRSQLKAGLEARATAAPVKDPTS